MLTVAQGIPLAVVVESANRHDMKLVQSTLEAIPVERPEPTPEQPQGLCLDKGYDYDEVREIVQAFGFTAHLRARGEAARAIKHEAGFKARRLCRGTHPQLDESLPAHLHALGEAGRHLPGHAASGPGHHYLAGYRPIGIGS